MYPTYSTEVKYDNNYALKLKSVSSISFREKVIYIPRNTLYYIFNVVVKRQI